MRANPGYTVLACLAALALQAGKMMDPSPSQQQTEPRNIPYSQLLTELDAGHLKEVLIQGPHIRGKFGDGREFGAYVPDDPALVDGFLAKGVVVTAVPPNGDGQQLGPLMLALLPALFLIGMAIGMSRGTQDTPDGPLAFSRGRIRLQNGDRSRVTFKDVAGVDEAREDLEEIVAFLRNPGRFRELGGRIPCGVLLVGAPGAGKTLIARAVAGEADVPFFTTSGSDFVEMYAGVGASRVRDMFAQARKSTPCIVFIDEIDAVGRRRGAGLGSGNDEREQTLNQLLVEMDGFEPNDDVIIIAATNRPDILDVALLRPGRFDRQIAVLPPDVAGRVKILEVHVRNVPMAPDVDLAVIARGTPGFSGADLKNLVNEAALMAARRDRPAVVQADFEEAKDKAMMGAVRKSLAMTEEERELTAYHEAGHALVALDVGAADPVHKVTIIPRGQALGMVLQLPERDRQSTSYRQMTARLAITMGGRVAEELVFGAENVSSGAQSDIREATRLARMMVTRWGFSPELGIVAYGESQGGAFLDMPFTRRHVVSKRTAQKIDEEIRRLIDEGHHAARRILDARRAELEILAKALLQLETLSGDQVADLLARK